MTGTVNICCKPNFISANQLNFIATRITCLLHRKPKTGFHTSSYSNKRNTVHESPKKPRIMHHSAQQKWFLMHQRFPHLPSPKKVMWKYAPTTSSYRLDWPLNFSSKVGLKGHQFQSSLPVACLSRKEIDVAECLREWAVIRGSPWVRLLCQKVAR